MHDAIIQGVVYLASGFGVVILTDIAHSNRKIWAALSKQTDKINSHAVKIARLETHCGIGSNDLATGQD